MTAESPPTGETPTGETLQALFESASRLALAAAPLKRIAVQANGISLELEWPSPPEGSPSPSPGPAGPAEQPAAVAADQAGHYCLRAPTVGTFYHRPSPAPSPLSSRDRSCGPVSRSRSWRR